MYILCVSVMLSLRLQVNPSTVDWPLQAGLSGAGFSGPEAIVAKALSTTCYPLTFNPKKEGQVEVTNMHVHTFSQNTSSL